MTTFNPEQFKLLIVDDIPNNIQVLGNILHEHGYKLSFATSGRQALDLISSENYDLILLDIMMPDMDGYEVCMKLKQDPATRDIPVIFLTAKNDVESIVKGFETGAVDYITKPFYSDELNARVKTHLELKHIREQLLLSNTTKDMFFSIIAHDLKNPLHAILGFSELLVNNFDSMNKAKILKYIDNISDSGKNLYKLLENLLQWSRLQTGRIKCNRESINFLTVLNRCLETLYSTYTMKKINIVKNVNPEIRVFADSDMTELILRNLISNAIKFTNTEGEIRISSKITDSFVCTEISDNGIGISEENIQKLFRIDTKYSTPGTANETGTGLGLILCKEFVEKNKGKIWVESKIGIGSVFKFTLPYASHEH